jgi:precorrin-3B synthase
VGDATEFSRGGTRAGDEEWIVSHAAAIEVKGWCPGALRPMPSGDGLLVRVRPWCGAFTLDQARGLAEIAERLGNGHIDLTRRANLQIRGLREDSMSELHRALDRIGLLDSDAETEAARNVMVAPLAGSDVRAIAAALTEALAADRRFTQLPVKFGWLVDGGGPLSIIGERAEIALYATAQGVALRAGGRWIGVAAVDRAVSVALTIAETLLDGGAMPSLAKMDVVPAPGRRMLGPLPGAFGIAAPFGRLEAAQLQNLAALSAKAGASEIRLSPWRALYIDAPIDGANDLGLIVDENDPLLRIEACPGAPACNSATVDTRHDARRLAASGFDGTIHVSGCAKGCARSGPADLVLVGDRGRYGVIHHGTTRDAIERMIDPGEVLTHV